MTQIDISGDAIECIVVPKGTIVTAQNPLWDGDDPDTHFYINILLPEDIQVTALGNAVGTVIEERFDDEN